MMLTVTAAIDAAPAEWRGRLVIGGPVPIGCTDFRNYQRLHEDAAQLEVPHNRYDRYTPCRKLPTIWRLSDLVPRGRRPRSPRRSWAIAWRSSIAPRAWAACAFTPGRFHPKLSAKPSCT